ncbi:hypothetical protein [Streptomyces europaeiscabiei]|uniref:hypothetical protein n=1 Tax=Streptomyces europaeiscabiei TaxID=146819 RepID=UPI0029A5A27C|nr:hypothetical protein [Streptomyces europaeiscabiei]MDX3781424.1 hypothetical protein [Streptomyces europaeiscabiei]
MRSVLGKVFGTIAAGAALALAVNSPAMAVTFEKETGSYYNLNSTSNPPGTRGYCVEIGIAQSRACFGRAGDVIYVVDEESDFHNVYAKWDNHLKNASGDWVGYRSGECWNKMGTPYWVSCNKDFYEDDARNAKNGHGSRIRLTICIDDLGDPTCETDSWIRNDA